MGKVRCDNVHVLHKYSDPVNVNMTVREGAGWPLAGWPGRGWRGHSPLRILVLIGGGGGEGRRGGLAGVSRLSTLTRRVMSHPHDNQPGDEGVTSHHHDNQPGDEGVMSHYHDHLVIRG